MLHTQKERKAIPIGILSCQSAIRLPVEIVALGNVVKVTEQFSQSHRASGYKLILSSPNLHLECLFVSQYFTLFLGQINPTSPITDL